MHPALQELVEPFERMPTAEASRILVERYGLEPIVFEKLDTERDDSFRVTTGATQYSMKVAHPRDDPAVVDLQLSAMAHAAVADPGLALQRVVAGLDGEAMQYAGPTGGRMVRLLTWLDGDLAHGFEPTPSQLRASGVMLGRVSRALCNFEHPAARRTLAWDIRRLGLLKEHATSETASAIARFDSEVAPRLDELPQQVIHNDFHPANILVDASHPEYVVGVLDFGDVVYGARINDLGVALAYLTPQGDLLSAVQPFIDGYESVVPLLPAEKAILPDLVSARLVQRIVLGTLLQRTTRGT